MKISIDMTKSVEENSSIYFEKSKKAKKKLEGLKKAILISKKKLDKIPKPVPKIEKKERKKHWYEKFRWFKTTKGDLVIAGRDATTNEIIIKKHTDKDDLVFHTEMSGSPFAVLKSKDEDSIKETSVFLANYSKAWTLGLAATEVFYVNPEQVSKTPPSGEYLQKGSFMIYGKKEFVRAELDLSIGIDKDGAVFAGPTIAVKKHSKEFVTITPGKEKTSSIAKKIQKKIGGELDEIVRAIPAGGVEIVKR